MKTTEKRISIALTKEDLRMLTTIENLLGENVSQVIKRALDLLYHEKIKEGL